jgi:hypothetical protein
MPEQPSAWNAANEPVGAPPPGKSYQRRPIEIGRSVLAWELKP